MFNKTVDSTTAPFKLNDNRVAAISGFNLATTPHNIQDGLSTYRKLNSEGNG